MNSRYFSISFLFCFRRLPPRRFLAQELENVRLLPMHWLINLFEFSNQSKNSNLFAGFFLLKYRCKWIYLILSVNTQNWFIVWFNQWCQKFSNIFFWISVLTFDKRNQSGQHLQVTFQIKFTFWHEIQNIDFVFWQVKSNKFICFDGKKIGKKNPDN